MSSISRFWFLRKDNGAIYGPVAEETLQAWARDGRVAPEDYVSSDQINWIPSFELSSLDMVWLVELPDGLEYGPAHRDALESLLADSSLSPPLRMRHVVTGERTVLGTAGDAVLESAGEPPPAELVHKGDTQPISLPDAAIPAEHVSSPAVAVESTNASGAAALETPPAAEPDRTLGWRTIALERDHFEREACKWKAMYDQIAARLNEQTARAHELQRSAEQERLAANAECTELRRRIDELSAELERALARPSGPDPHLMQAYHELVRNYDVLAAQLTAKEETERCLREEIAALRREYESALATAQEREHRERELAEHAHRRLSELERAHLELVRSYRELNDRYIRLRTSVPATPESPVVSSPNTAPGATPAPGTPNRLKLFR